MSHEEVNKLYAALYDRGCIPHHTRFDAHSALRELSEMQMVTSVFLRQKLGDLIPGFGHLAAKSFGVTPSWLYREVEKGRGPLPGVLITRMLKSLG